MTATLRAETITDEFSELSTAIARHLADARHAELHIEKLLGYLTEAVQYRASENVVALRACAEVVKRQFFTPCAHCN
jgi:hypothetical protein